MPADFLVFSSRACPRCRSKPCRVLARATAVVVSPRNIPSDCPLKIPSGRALPSGLALDRIDPLAAARAASRTLPHGLPSHLPGGHSLPAWHASGLISVLSVPFGSDAWRALKSLQAGKRAASRRAAEQAFAADAAEAKTAKKSPALENPVWLGKKFLADTDEGNSPIASASPGDTVWLKVDCVSLSLGDSVLFIIQKKNGDRLDTISGTVAESSQGDTATVRFTLPMSLLEKSGAPTELNFVAKRNAQRLEVKGPALRVEPDVGLRFDLAIDPGHAKVQGDVFILKGLDSEYSQTRSVKDDKVSGDALLTLVFTGVVEGKRYALSQVHQGEEAVLYPEVVYKAAAAKSSSTASKASSRPSHIVGFKAAFRECRMLGETKDLWNRKDTEHPFQLDFAKDKWVYVFAGPPGGATRLVGEYLGAPQGGFRAVNLGESRGQDHRDPVTAVSEWLTLPLRVGEQKLDLFACLSQVQLPWKRIATLEHDPKARCYHLGDEAGGVCWMPDQSATEIRSLLKSKDARIENPGEDVVLFGLIDYLHEARRRAELYEAHVRPYLELRFDHPRPGETSAQRDARRRKKYVAGIIKVLVDTSHGIQQIKLKSALKDSGKDLDNYLLQENTLELDLKKKAEACGAALVKWMDHPARGFEEALSDYTSDPGQVGLWDKAEAEYSFLIRYFDVTSLTRLYGRRIYKDKTAWIHRYFLDEDAFAAARKTTQASVEILAWLGRVVVQSETFRVESLEKMCGVFFPGFKFEWTAHKKSGSATTGLDLFHDEAKALSQERKVYLHSLEAPGLRQELKILRVSRSSKPLEQLEHIADSNLTKTFLFGVEVWNLFLAVKNLADAKTMESSVGVVGSLFDFGNLLGEVLRIGGKQLGRGFLSVVGAISGFFDTIAAGIESAHEASERDYDAMASKVLVASGSASILLGSSMVAYTVYSTMSGGILWAGSGISLTGAGAPVGASLVLLGMAAQAGGSLIYLLANDSPLEKWIKECPLGTVQKWNFMQTPESRKELGQLYSFLYPYSLAAEHQVYTAQSGYSLAIKGTFNPHTKITLRTLTLMDKENRLLHLFQDEIIEEGFGKPYHIQLIPGQPTTLYLKVNDVWCWDQHRKHYPGAPNGFKSLHVEIEIDVNGDGEVLWPVDRNGKPFEMEIK